MAVEAGSFLSPYYQTFLKTFEVPSEWPRPHDYRRRFPDSSKLATDGFADTAGISSHDDHTDEWFRAALCQVAPLAHFCRSLLEGAKTSGDVDLDEADVFQWLSAPWVFQETRDEVRALKGCDTAAWTIQALLKTTCVLDRSLGNVLYSAGVVPVPPLLRDIVFCPQLATLVGEGRACLLILLFGSPKSLNLRNLAWHGFLSPGEVHPSLVSLIVILAMDIGRHLKDVSLSERRSSRLKAFAFPMCEEFFYQEHKLDSYPVKGREVMLDTCRDLYQKERFFDALCLLLTELELVARYLFVMHNGCEERLLSAQTGDFYTTFSEILAEHLANGKTNRVFSYLPRSVVHLLFDLFVLPDGPRLRDKVSHAELDLDGEEREDLAHWCNVVAAVISVVSGNVDVVPDYEPLCHPVSFILSNVANAAEVLDSIRTFSWPDLSCLEVEPPDLSDVLPVTYDEEDSHFHLLLTAVQVTGNVWDDGETTKRFLHILRNLPPQLFPTLFRPKTEYKLLSVLKTLSASVEQCCRDVFSSIGRKTEGFQLSSLSKRQENSFWKMILVLPAVCQGLIVTLVLVVCLLLTKSATCASDKLQTYLSRLKTSQRLVSKVRMCIKRSQWEETRDILETLRAHSQKFELQQDWDLKLSAPLF